MEIIPVIFFSVYFDHLYDIRDIQSYVVLGYTNKPMILLASSANWTVPSALSLLMMITFWEDTGPMLGGMSNW